MAGVLHTRIHVVRCAKSGGPSVYAVPSGCLYPGNERVDRKMSPSRTSKATLGEKTSVSAAGVLREAIISGDLAPGQVLGEEQLGRQLGISRTPVREALVLLRSEGLVDTPPNRPAIVRNFDRDDLHEIYSIRAVLEGYAARLAAERLTDQDLATLERTCERYHELGRHDER